MKYCAVRGRNVPERRCKHTQCQTRIGYCHYYEGYTACGHTECRITQGERLNKLISGMTGFDRSGRIHDIRRRKRPTKPPIGRMSDGVRNPAFRQNRITKSGNVDKRRKWREYANVKEYIAAGK